MAKCSIIFFGFSQHSLSLKFRSTEGTLTKSDTLQTKNVYIRLYSLQNVHYSIWSSKLCKIEELCYYYVVLVLFFKQMRKQSQRSYLTQDQTKWQCCDQNTNLPTQILLFFPLEHAIILSDKQKNNNGAKGII